MEGYWVGNGCLVLGGFKIAMPGFKMTIYGVLCTSYLHTQPVSSAQIRTAARVPNPANALLG